MRRGREEKTTSANLFDRIEWCWFRYIHFDFLSKIYPSCIGIARVIVVLWHFYHRFVLHKVDYFLVYIQGGGGGGGGTCNIFFEYEILIAGSRPENAKVKDWETFQTWKYRGSTARRIRERCLKCLQNLRNPSERVICECLTRDGFTRSHERRRAYGIPQLFPLDGNKSREVPNKLTERRLFVTTVFFRSLMWIPGYPTLILRCYERLTS